MGQTNFFPRSAPGEKVIDRGLAELEKFLRVTIEG